jgi:hypothetical protein
VDEIVALKPVLYQPVKLPAVAVLMEKRQLIVA